jgi:hypothetical protein
MAAPASKELGDIEDGDAAPASIHRAYKPRPGASIGARGAGDMDRVSLVFPFAAAAAVTVGQDQPVIFGKHVDGGCYLATPPPDPAASVARPQHSSTRALPDVESAQRVRSLPGRNQLPNPTLSRLGAAPLGRPPTVRAPRR